MTPNQACPRPWRSELRPCLTPLQRAWLLQPGALTAGLRQLGALTLQVCRETTFPLPSCWAREAGLAQGTAVWWREILMSLNGMPAVQACSFTPRAASLGVWKAMRGLGTHPLADILYSDPRIRRSAFRFGVLAVDRPTGRRDQPPLCEHAQARHSVFMREGSPLLVAEYFLPSFWTLACAPGATGPRGRFPRYGCESPAARG